MISWIKHLFTERLPTLKSSVCGRELTGLFITESTARFRFSEGDAILINLETRNFRPFRPKLFTEWITFPGWLRVVDVKESASQITLTVSGAIYSSRITLTNKGDHWQMSLSGGNIF
jgi:hypothetical protein